LTCHSDFFEALIPEITFEQIAIKEKFNRDRNIVKPRIHFMQFFLDIHARMFDDNDEKQKRDEPNHRFILDCRVAIHTHHKGNDFNENI
jgi:hypothetical protein